MSSYAYSHTRQVQSDKADKAELIRVRAELHQLQNEVAKINLYDKQVQKIISASAILQEAWDNFRIQYQLTASQSLLETANEKIAGKREGICHGCQREFGDMRDYDFDRLHYKENVERIRSLEALVARLQDAQR